MTTPTDPIPVPGPDTPRWTVDDEGELSFGEPGPLCVDLLHLGGATRAIRRVAYDALVADVRAARVHESCAHTTDTLRQARQLAASIQRLENDHTPLGHLLDLLADGGGDD
jgi:hypothetical protein